VIFSVPPAADALGKNSASKDGGARPDQLPKSENSRALECTKQINREVNSFAEIQAPLDIAPTYSSPMILADNCAPNCDGPVSHTGQRYLCLGCQHHA